MKIAIITFNRIYNYGSRLQTYALNRFLTKEKCEVKTIDYVQPKQEEKRSRLYESIKGILSIGRNVQLFIYKKQIKTSRQRFDEFSKQYIPSTESYYEQSQLSAIEKEFDIFICGSDQIWNPMYFGFDASYLLSFVKDKSKCISYAASIGISNITQADKILFKNHIEDFNSVLVREETAVELLREVLTTPPNLVLDPVFLLDASEWELRMSAPIFKKPYILCYLIGDIEGMRKQAKRLAKETGLPLVVIRPNLRDWLGCYKRYYKGGPEEFLSLIKNAEYVFTNSFHAVAFSLIFHKKFWVFSQEASLSSQSRIETILNKVRLETRKIYSTDVIIEWDKTIDFKEIDSILNKEIQKSKELLFKAIERKSY